MLRNNIKINTQFNYKYFSLFSFLTSFLLISLYLPCYADKPPRTELIWYQYAKSYKNLKDVKEDLKKGILVHPPKFFEELNIVNKGVGDIDPENASYYWSAKPGTLGLMLFVAREFKLRLKNPEAELPVSGLLRTLEYQNILSCYNNWADLGRSTHTNGATFDITVHPLFMHNDIKKIDTLVLILRELHKKGEVYFIDEASNSCLHVCLHPDYEEKYAEIYYNIAGEYELSSSYAHNRTRFKPFKEPDEIREAISKGTLLSLLKIREKLSANFCFPENYGEDYYSLRPETTALLMEITERLKKDLGKEFLLPLSELIRTYKEQKEIVKSDPSLPLDSPFVYGAAFQIDASKLCQTEISLLEKHLQELSSSNDIIFIKKRINKYDVAMKACAIPKYNIAYQKNIASLKEKSFNSISFRLELKYLYITIVMLLVSLTGLIIHRFYRLRQIIKRIKKMKRKKKVRIKKSELVIINAANTMTVIKD
ncbi:MAG: hypothetical protein BWY64_01249 [bacterium ADurb.Bin363]|nr:MAG: hypothetical protein BWY64_01249 [bacterium ADurb.Bin363]